MVPEQKVKDLIDKHRNLEKELSLGNINPKLFAKKSKEYSNLGNIIDNIHYLHIILLCKEQM